MPLQVIQQHGRSGIKHVLTKSMHVLIHLFKIQQDAFLGRTTASSIFARSAVEIGETMVSLWDRQILHSGVKS